MYYIAILTSFFFFLLLPDEALAWGPATHLEIGSRLLENARFVAPAVRAVIEAFPHDFLYGNISADIVVGKNLVEELKHCHNWKIGFKILKKADGDAQKSFAYGYLTHLAADTVAHNYFIPEMMIRSFSARTLRHIYWELRFDALADKRMWKLPREIARKAHHENDFLLEAIIEDTPLPFRTNKTIFNSMASLQRVESWHRLLDRLSNASRWTLHREDKDKFFDRAYMVSLELLKHQKNAPCVRRDPTGKHNLNSAKHIRKKLKEMRRRGRDWETAMDNALEMVRSDGSAKT